MGSLIVSALIAIAAGNAGIWWFWRRKQAAALRAARAHAKTLRSLKNWWQKRATAAEQALVDAPAADAAARGDVTATLHERMETNR